jgi:hypothetical protein
MSQAPTRTVSHPAIWREEFDLSDGTTGDTGDSAWTIQAGKSSKGTAVRHGKFRALDSNAETVWRSGKIDTAGAKRISIALDAIKIGNFDASDSLAVYYKIGDGDYELIESLRFSLDPQEDFETFQVRKEEIDVLGHRQIQIIVRARVNGADKALYWDRIEVTTP